MNAIGLPDVVEFGRARSRTGIVAIGAFAKLPATGASLVVLAKDGTIARTIPMEGLWLTDEIRLEWEHFETLGIMGPPHVTFLDDRHVLVHVAQPAQRHFLVDVESGDTHVFDCGDRDTCQTVHPVGRFVAVDTSLYDPESNTTLRLDAGAGQLRRTATVGAECTMMP
jgi:hypothetical protein